MQADLQHDRPISIHAPREGGDGSSANYCHQYNAFQSTPPARGATFYMAALLTSLGISIHAPREGGYHIKGILCIPHKISIHAPREGGDGMRGSRPPSRHRFQSTPPARGATPADGQGWAMICISIHAPREGGDWVLLLRLAFPK